MKQFSENMQKLEMKIIKINKIGVIKSEVIGNATKSYNKLNTEFNENERYNNKEKMGLLYNIFYSNLTKIISFA